MKRSLRRITAFAAAAAMLGGSVASGQNSIFKDSEKVYAAGWDNKCCVELDYNSNNRNILLDDGYYLYNEAVRVTPDKDDQDVFIIPAECDVNDENPNVRSEYGSYGETYRRIFVLEGMSVRSEEASRIIVSDGLLEMHKDAFFYCPKLRSVTLPDSLIILEDQHFGNDVTLRGHVGSLAEKYASSHDHTFEYIGDIDNSSVINAADLLKLISSMNGEKALDEDEAARADENYDAKLNIADLVLLKNEITDPKSSVLGASCEGALAKPDFSGIKAPSSVSADGYRKFASESAAKVLIDTKDQRGEKNTVYSPLSYYMALSMAAECAAGNTQDELLAALGAGNIDALRKENGQIFKSLYFDDYTAYCRIANSLWLNDKWKMKQDTLDAIAANYYAPSFARDFSDSSVPAEISAWISKNTSGKFQPEIQIADPETEIMKILNTVTFKEAWVGKFSDAKPDIFTTDDGEKVTCDFMGYSQTGKEIGFADKYMRCYEELKDGFRMHFILPDEGVELSDILSDAEEMKTIYSNNEEYLSRKVIFSVPKFDVSSKFDMIEATKALGVEDAFSELKGDFTNVIDYEENNIPSAYLSEITHEAIVTIDEEGCEAAAYTIVSLLPGCAPMPEEEPVYFELDRPFFYYISDKNDTPLFAGIINDPTQK